MKLPIKRLLTVLIVLVLSFATVSHLHAETQVSISISDNLATIGDQITLKFLVKTTRDIDKINLQPDKKEFETVAQQPTQMRKQPDYTVFEKNILVTFFKTGDFELGPFTVQLIKGENVVETKKTNAVPITIKSVLTEEDKDIKAIKNPVQLKGDPYYILKYVFIALLIVFLAIFLYLRWKKKRRPAPAPLETPLSPLEELEFRVNQLDQNNLVEKGKPKLHFFELTRILKHFLFRHYRFNAEDLTTYETMLVLRGKETDELISENLRFLLSIADLVKFAKFVPDEGVMTEVSAKLNALLASYKQRLVTIEQPAQKESA
ncbi:MAG: hypothetical protein GY940_21875 [bacterium]|nr:hypothetical protein [bacterium]